MWRRRKGNWIGEMAITEYDWNLESGVVGTWSKKKFSVINWQMPF